MNRFALILGLTALTAQIHAQGLAAVLQATLLHNPAVRGKQAEVAAQGFAVDSAEAQRLPSLSADLNNLGDNFDDDQGTLRLDQPLWTFGKIDNAIAQAKAGVAVEQQSLLQVRRELIERTAVVYTQIQGLQRRARVASDNIAEHQRLIQHITRRLKGQLATEADVSLGNSRLILARSQHQRLQGEMRNAQTELQALTIVPVSAAGGIPGPLTQLPPAGEIHALALSQAADLQIKQARVGEAQLQVKAERVAPLPDLYLRAEHIFGGRNLAGFDDDTRVGLVLQATFEGLGAVSRGRTRGAEARYRASQEDLQVTRTEVQRQVTTLLSDRQVLGDLIRAQQAAVSEVQKTAASYVRLYDSGRKPWMDVLNIQREVTEQRLQLEQVKSEHLQTTLRIAAMVGLLDEIAGIEAP
jgi:adhesin transport system outer membrane protein